MCAGGPQQQRGHARQLAAPQLHRQLSAHRRDIDDTGFSAHWQTSFFATNLEDALRQCASRQCEDFSGAALA
jgi:inner membrane protein involved in colicin E2 resistance